MILGYDFYIAGDNYRYVRLNGPREVNRVSSLSPEHIRRIIVKKVNYLILHIENAFKYKAEMFGIKNNSSLY